MATITFDDYMRQKESHASTTSGERKLSNVSFFQLKPGEEAIVRFAYEKPSEFEMKTCHSIRINGRLIRINCNRQAYEPVDNCLFCKSGNEETRKISTRFFVKLIQYVLVDGKITPKAMMWDRARSFAETLNQFYLEYGPIYDTVFKVRREGTGLDTKYTVIPASPKMYTEENGYVKDFHDFEGWTPKGPLYKEYTNEQIQEILETGQLPQFKRAEQPTGYATPTPSAPAESKWTLEDEDDLPFEVNEVQPKPAVESPAPSNGPKRTTYIF